MASSKYQVITTVKNGKKRKITKFWKKVSMSNLSFLIITLKYIQNQLLTITLYILVHQNQSKYKASGSGDKNSNL